MATERQSKRPRLEAPGQNGGSYFSTPSKTIEFFSSGCTLLNCVLGGGWALGRFSNVVGDKATGKTLLAIEAAANFASEYPDGRIRYAEAEGAFDKEYATALGLPLGRVEFTEDEAGPTVFTIEDWYEDLEAWVKTLDGAPGFYVLDSFDALSDRAELKREIDEATYGGTKAKQSSQLFRRVTQVLHQKRVHVMVISQVRDNIGVMFGEKHTRSGGKALDFYSSQTIWLAQVKTFKKTIKGVERPIGAQIKARCKKNKIGLPFRECFFDLMFGFGVDDLSSNLAWLIETKRLDAVSMDNETEVKKYLKDLPNEKYRDESSRISVIVRQQWSEIEKEFLPTHKKYG